MDKLNIWLVADELTTISLKLEEAAQLSGIFKCRSKVDFLLVESAWHGSWNLWKYKIAAYPDHPERTNRKLQKLVSKARDRGIPTVFWNKEDGVHFERFIDSAKLFDHVLTVDANMIPRYKAVMGERASIHTMMFAVQPKIHYFSGFNFKYYRANFVGSYSHHLHSLRRDWQNKLFQATATTGLGLTVFDRNSKRKSPNYRFPRFNQMDILQAIAYPDTAQVYRDYLVSLNVNTVVDSPTMFSRRLIEILACGGIAITTPSVSVSRLFQDYCHVVESSAEMEEYFIRLKSGPSKEDLERARAGAQHIANYHTWLYRLMEIQKLLKI